MWGAGCIIAELWTRCPLLKGESELDQLQLIMNLCGSISPATWPSVVNLDIYKKIELRMGIPRTLRERLASISAPSAIDLIDRLLVCDPSRRLTADQALAHEFFQEDLPPGDLPSL